MLRDLGTQYKSHLRSVFDGSFPSVFYLLLYITGAPNDRRRYNVESEAIRQGIPVLNWI